MKKHQHKWKYSVAEYISASFIYRRCKCGAASETNTPPLKWKAQGSLDIRLTTSKKEPVYLYAQDKRTITPPTVDK